MRLSRPAMRLRPIVATAVAFAVAVSLTAQQAAADVAQHIPDDALLVLKINNLQQVNQRAGNLAREFGIAEQDPAAANPLQAFQEQTGIREGLRLDGDMALYLANRDQEGDRPPVVVLIPVRDYQAFLNNFDQRQDLGQGITQVHVGEDEPVPSYVRQMGDFAALTPLRELLTEPGEGIRFTGVTGQRVNERDIVLYANFRALAPRIRQGMEERNVRAEARRDMLQQLQENEETRRFVPVAEAAMDQAFAAFDTFLRDTVAATVGLDLREEGIGMGVVAQFDEDSYLANIFGRLNASDAPLLSGLPEGTYIMFGGAVDNREVNQRLFDDLLGPVIQRLRQVEGTERMAEWMDAVKTQVTAAGDTRFGLFAPTGPLGASPVIQQVTIQSGDVEELKRAQRRVTELQPQIMADLMGQDMEEMEMDVQMEYQENAREVAGVSFDRMRAQMGDPQQQDMMQMQMNMLFGPEGPVTYLGSVNDKLLMINGLNENQIRQVVEAVRNDSAPLARQRGVQAVNEHLPENRSAVMYIAPDEAIRSALGLARQMGLNLPVQLPDDLPPVGIAFGPEQNALQAESFVSKDLISALIVAALQMQQQFGGGFDDDGL